MQDTRLLHFHGDGHDHHHNHAPRRLPQIAFTRRQMSLIVALSVLYLLSESTVDSFDILEAASYWVNEPIKSVTLHAVGSVASVVTTLPVLATVIYNGLLDQHHHHTHSKIQTVLEAIAIGGPFALLGIAAYLEAFEELFGINVNELTLGKKIASYFGGAVSALIAAGGAFELHKFHLHAGSEEHGGGLKGFVKGLWTTFVANVWGAHRQQESALAKVKAVLGDFYFKYGIVAGHWFLGEFAVNAFLEGTGLALSAPFFASTLMVALPLLVVVIESNTEGRSLEASQQQANNYAFGSKVLVTLAGVLHALPSATAMAQRIGQYDSGPWDGKLYNGLIYCTSTLAVGIPSTRGFSATMVMGFDTAVKSIYSRLTKLCYAKNRNGYEEIDSDSDLEIDSTSGEESSYEADPALEGASCTGKWGTGFLNFFKGVQASMACSGSSATHLATRPGH